MEFVQGVVTPHQLPNAVVVVGRTPADVVCPVSVVAKSVLLVLKWPWCRKG